MSKEKQGPVYNTMKFKLSAAAQERLKTLIFYFIFLQKNQKVAPETKFFTGGLGMSPDEFSRLGRGFVNPIFGIVLPDNPPDALTVGGLAQTIINLKADPKSPWVA